MADGIAAAGSAASDTPADDPSDVDDDDDDSDDMALPARIVPHAPPFVAIRPTWSLRSLADKHPQRTARPSAARRLSPFAPRARATRTREGTRDGASRR